MSKIVFSKIATIVFCATTIFASTVAFSAVKDEISARTAPVGELCMVGQECAAAPVAVASGPRSGEDIYNSKCSVCHVSGVAGSPKLGDVAAWAPRLDQGIETLYVHAIKGFNGMPAKGLCMDCSDDEIKATVDYMVVKSK